jgi:hypothetical protein
MAKRIYINYNYIVVDKDGGAGLEYIPRGSSVLQRDENSYLIISNLNGSGGGTFVDIRFTDITNWFDETGTVAFTESSFLDFITSSTGFNVAVGTASQTLVTQANKDRTLGGVIDSTKVYVIDGIIDMGSTQITVPVTGITLSGYSFDISGLVSSEDNYTMFVSETPLIGSGNMLGFDYFIEVTGVNSKVYNVYSSNGFGAFEFSRINYNNCTSLGDLYNYRQGLEIGSGRLGGSPTLTLNGLWRGGYRISTSIVRGLDAGMTTPLFRAGTGFLMNSRFLTDMNFDLPSLASLVDFSPANFPNPSTLQLSGCIATRNGVANSSDLTLTPNITQKSLSCNWRNNIGLPNTFIGGLKTLSTEVETVLLGASTPTILLGTWVSSDEQHFDSNFNYSFRHLGIDPKDFRVTFDFVLRGTQDEQYRISFKKNAGGVVTEIYSQTRTIDRLAGLRDVAYLSGTFGIQTEQNNFMYWEVENITTGASCFLEVDSQWFIEAR